MAISRHSAVVNTLFEAALVNYVVPGSLPPTTHSHDSAFRVMRCRALGDIPCVCAIFGCLKNCAIFGASLLGGGEEDTTEMNKQIMRIGR